MNAAKVVLWEMQDILRTAKLQVHKSFSFRIVYLNINLIQSEAVIFICCKIIFNGCHSSQINHVYKSICFRCSTC